MFFVARDSRSGFTSCCWGACSLLLVYFRLQGTATVVCSRLRSNILIQSGYRTTFRIPPPYPDLLYPDLLHQLSTCFAITYTGNHCRKHKAPPKPSTKYIFGNVLYVD